MQYALLFVFTALSMYHGEVYLWNVSSPTDPLWLTVQFSEIYAELTGGVSTQVSVYSDFEKTEYLNCRFTGAQRHD